MKPRNEPLRAGLVEEARLPAPGSGRRRVRAVEAGRIVRQVCRSFARDVDWQHRTRISSNGRGDGPGPGCCLSENHEGLHSGRYITVDVVAGGKLVVRGGYYDRCLQPQPVYRQSVPLGELTAQGLGSLLRDMHQGLGSHVRERFT